MKKGTKLAIVLLAAVVLAGVLIYPLGTLSLGSRIPDKDWVRMEMRYALPESPEQAEVFDLTEMPEVLERIRTQRVIRSRTNQALEDAYWIVLEASDGTALELRVEESGNVRLCGNIPEDRWGDYRGAGALHIYLANVRLLLQHGIDRIHN